MNEDMGAIAEKLKELLGNTPTESAGSDGFDMASVMKIKSAYDKINSRPDPRVALLNSLRPFMNENRSGTIDSVVKILNLTKISQVVKELEGGI